YQGLAALTGRIVSRLRVVAMSGVTRPPAAALSGWPRRMSAGSAERTTVGGGARRAAGPVAVGRFHRQPV
ncbi:MAG: hypothetical protein ABSC06_02995, partial [Rhodopila sp.]